MFWKHTPSNFRIRSIDSFYANIFIFWISMDELPHMPEMSGSPDITSAVCKARMAEKFLSKTRDEWVDIFDGSDACVTPILELNEAADHPHNKERESFVTDLEGDVSPVWYHLVYNLVVIRH